MTDLRQLLPPLVVVDSTMPIPVRVAALPVCHGPPDGLTSVVSHRLSHRRP